LSPCVATGVDRDRQEDLVATASSGLLGSSRCDECRGVERAGLLAQRHHVGDGDDLAGEVMESYSPAVRRGERQIQDLVGQSGIQCRPDLLARLGRNAGGGRRAAGAAAVQPAQPRRTATTARFMNRRMMQALH
jgi:hypothetical protein